MQPLLSPTYVGSLNFGRTVPSCPQLTPPAIAHFVLQTMFGYSLLQNLLTASNQPHNSLTSWHCSRCPPSPQCSFNQSIPLSPLQNRHGPDLGPGLRFLKGALLPNCNKMVEAHLLIERDQQPADITSTVLKDLRASLNVSVWQRAK